MIRERVIDQVWFERLTVMNNRSEPISLHLEMLVDADFADIFEIKQGELRPRRIARRHEGTGITMSYAREHFKRVVTISASMPARTDPSARSVTTWRSRRARSGRSTSR